MTQPVTKPFVSHAQNFEDVMLWRALGGLGEGFYIDVGASDPYWGSVTLAFYERGWHGINIEPDPALFALLVEQRPRDVNLDVGVSSTSGSQTMFFVPNTGNSTLDEREGRLREQEGRVVERRVIPVETLAQIWERHVPSGQEVHFLKIDVEGAEREVLAGLDLTTMRPWIVVAEATRPNTREPSHQDFEPILVHAGYDVVHRDGINRFYLAREHGELASTFEFPPNYWDHFIPSIVVRSQDRERAAKSELQATRRELERLKRSRSWRLTRPLRAIGSALRRRRGGSARS
jgi:FkbM family methyltransferase